MRLKMDNPRFLFIFAVSTLVLLTLSSKQAVIAPCFGCLATLDNEFRVVLINKTDAILDFFLECGGSIEKFTVHPGESAPLDVEAGVWKWTAVNHQGYLKEGNKLVASGTFSGSTKITVSRLPS